MPSLARESELNSSIPSFYRLSYAYTFQAILHKNGDIVFIYKNVPQPIRNISDSNHPVKLGISDAYMFKHPTHLSTQPKRVIYEYHRIELTAEKISSNTVVILKAQPTCIALETCDSCTNATIPHFNCIWCHSKKSHGGPFCTDETGLHRRRQQWFEGNCNQRSKSLYCDANDEDETYDAEDYAPVRPKLPSGSQPVVPLDGGKSSETSSEDGKYMQKKDDGGSGTATLTLIVILLVGIVGWLAYAYYNPHTTSGQMLIRYRPSRWHVPNSHVRYSASVHM
uniref:PSI domain-containing protein n=1 Tax=Caenorhabditis japonica TaxID=281687 RepID=A0A8R1DZU9_CAEJA